jgi:5-formyltetrahydrofolate cyclo-ligase
MSGCMTTASETPELKRVKAELRERLKAARAREARELPKAGAALASRFPEELLPGPGQVLSAFMPFGDEIDPSGIMALAKARGATLALPVVLGKGRPLVFRAWSFDEPLEKGVWGIEAPPASAGEVEPDVLLVPLLGFDHFGGRLGYGGGFYDRTLRGLKAKKPIVAIGVAFDAQRLFEVPTGPQDEPLDWVVTEAAAYRTVKEEGGEDDP